MVCVRAPICIDFLICVWQLTYDMQLEAVAQNYLNSLGSGSFSHNSRATADYAALGGSGYVGENW